MLRVQYVRGGDRVSLAVERPGPATEDFIEWRRVIAGRLGVPEASMLLKSNDGVVEPGLSSKYIGDTVDATSPWVPSSATPVRSMPTQPIDPRNASQCCWKGSTAAHAAHTQVCEWALLPCRFGCGVNGPRREMESHECRSKSAPFPAVLLSPPVRLNVGGKLILTSMDTLQKHPGSALAAFVSLGDNPLMTPAKCNRLVDGSIFIDRDSEVFGRVLAWLRSDVVPAGLRDVEKELMVAEARFWGLMELESVLVAKSGPLALPMTLSEFRNA